MEKAVNVTNEVAKKVESTLTALKEAQVGLGPTNCPSSSKQYLPTTSGSSAVSATVG